MIYICWFVIKLHNFITLFIFKIFSVVISSMIYWFKLFSAIIIFYTINFTFYFFKPTMWTKAYFNYAALENSTFQVKYDKYV